MIYLDTSVLLPLFVHEPTSHAVRSVLSAAKQDELAISEWSQTEFISAIGRHVRMALLKKEAAPAIVRKFQELVERNLVVLELDGSDFLTANGFLRRFELGLKAGDALHLAIASNHAAEVYSSDEVMLKCARRIGIKAHDLRP